MNWVLRTVLITKLNELPDPPDEIADEHEAFLEDAGLLLAASGCSLELLDVLGEEGDMLAARAIASLN